MSCFWKSRTNAPKNDKILGKFQSLQFFSENMRWARTSKIGINDVYGINSKRENLFGETFCKIREMNFWKWRVFEKSLKNELKNEKILTKLQSLEFFPENIRRASTSKICINDVYGINRNGENLFGETFCEIREMNFWKWRVFEKALKNAQKNEKIPKFRIFS